VSSLFEFDPGDLGRVGGGLRRIFLMPGGLFCTSEPGVVTTVLGSCVAVCLWDARHLCAGINHYVLPRCDTGEPGLRYGDVSISRLIERMQRLGCSLRDLEAKIFGGAAVLPVRDPAMSVGGKNIELALERMRALGIPIIARRTGGLSGLSVRMHTGNGAVLVKSIPHSVQLPLEIWHG
jgi:chemotaxis protein CheD